MIGMFPDLGTTNVQNLLLLGLIGIVFITFALLGTLSKCGFNQPAISTIGALATLGTQVVLAVNTWEKVPYLVFWHSGKLFGFLSTIGSGLMIAAVAPADRVGFWNGLNAGLSNAAAGSSQILFSRVYDSMNDGSEVGKRGQTMLLCTSVISFFSFFFYFILIPIWPKQEDAAKKKKKDDDYSDFAKYEAMPYAEWANQPMEVVAKVSEKMAMAGKEPRMITWGAYKDERQYLTGLADRSLGDFNFFKMELQTLLTDRTKMVEQQKMQAAMDKAPRPDRDAAKLEMGAWIADYLDDAGYQDWEKMAPLYKSMFIQAFPPIDPLDDEKPDYGTMPVDKFEDALLKFLKVMDEHLSVEKARSRAKFSHNILAGLTQRR